MNVLVSPSPTQTDGVGWRRAIQTSAAIGIAWNLFGIAQLVSTLGADANMLMADGLSPAQAELYLALPAWMHVAFAIGVVAGLLGSALLLWRHRLAPAVLVCSLIAYAVLFAGDAMLGLFTAIPRQLPILSTVLLIAVGLLAMAQRARVTGVLR